MGESDFDLAKYGKSVSSIERLPMRGLTVSDDCYIEIMVKTKNLEGTPQTPGPQQNNSMSIENRISSQ